MTPTKTFDFKEQLNTGNVGEKMFLINYASKNPIKSEKDLTYDFLIDGDKKVELKTDTYLMSDTQNFFMERYGCVKSSKSGGPWRALEDGLDFFVYYYINDKTFFWFEPNSLCSFLEYHIKKYPSYKQIRNKGWTAMGYAVPRELCMPYVINIDKF